MVYKDGEEKFTCDVRKDSTASRKHGNVSAESSGGQGGSSICDLLRQEMSRRVWGLPSVEGPWWWNATGSRLQDTQKLLLRGSGATVKCFVTGKNPESTEDSEGTHGC